MEFKVCNFYEAASLLSEARSLFQTDAAIFLAIAKIQAPEHNFEENTKYFRIPSLLTRKTHDSSIPGVAQNKLKRNVIKTEALIKRVDALSPNRRQAIPNMLDSSTDGTAAGGGVNILL